MISALSALFSFKVIHRDFKPENILISAFDEHKQMISVILADFGIARSKDTMTTITTNLVGTFCYFAPEVVEEEKFSF